MPENRYGFYSRARLGAPNMHCTPEGFYGFLPLPPDAAAGDGARVAELVGHDGRLEARHLVQEGLPCATPRSGSKDVERERPPDEE